MGRPAKLTKEDPTEHYRALAAMAARVLEATPEEAEMLEAAALAGPMCRARIVEAVDGRALCVGIAGPTNRGKSTAWRGLGEELRKAGYKPLVVVEVDRDSTPAEGSIRLPVSMGCPDLPEDTDLTDAEGLDALLRGAAKIALKKSSGEVRTKTAIMGRLLRDGLASGGVFESLSSWWAAYYDLCQACFPDGHDDAYGKERNVAYREAWATAHQVFAQVRSREVARAVVGPIFGVIVCHMKPKWIYKPDGPNLFDQWVLDAGSSLATGFRKSPDFMVCYGSDSKDGPEDPYPRKKGGSYYARLTGAENAAAKARITVEEQALWDEHLHNPEKLSPEEEPRRLARALMAVYKHRRRAALTAIRNELDQTATQENTP